MKRLSIALLVLAVLFSFVSCKDNPEPEPLKVFYTVTFEMNGHGEDVPAQSVEEGSSAARPETDPSEERFAFLGWYKDIECTEKYGFLSPVTEDITLYAKWVEGITVTLFSNNGYGNGRALAFVGGTLAIEYRPACEDGVVEGYYTDSTFSAKVAEGDGTLLASIEGYTDESARWIKDSPVTLTTRWEYGIGFIDPFGYLASEIPSVTVKQGEKVTAPEASFKSPAADGYEYRWSTVPPDYYRDQTAFSFGQEVTSDMRLYLLYTYVGGDFTVGYALGQNYVARYVGTEVDVTVPANIDGKKIQSVRASAFHSGSGAAKVENVVFSEGIEVIGLKAFNVVPTLRSITIPSTVTTLEGGFLYSTGNLETINLSPENRAFAKVDGVIFTSDMAKVVAFENVRTFANLPDTVTELGSYAFQASKLESIVIPDSVTIIGSCAFQGCNNLKSVTLDSSSVYPFPEDLFYGCSSLANIYVPANLVSEYKAAAGWSAYASKISAMSGT